MKSGEEATGTEAKAEDRSECVSKSRTDRKWRTRVGYGRPSQGGRRGAEVGSRVRVDSHFGKEVQWRTQER